jgi:hypothetical protein
MGCMCGVLLALSWAAAAAPTDLTLDWWTVDAGAGTLVADGPTGLYTLVGTAGQPDAGVASGGGFTLGGGFIGGGEVVGAEQRVYLPLILRNR